VGASRSSGRPAPGSRDLAAVETAVLIVRHGPGRGRLQRYGDDWLERLGQTRPDLRRRVLIHETGSGLEPSLDGVAAVVFLLADPVRELYPACYTEAAGIARCAAERGIRLVNPPDALSNTIKSVQARLWKEAGIPCAGCVPFADRAGLEGVIGVLRFPVIVRADLLHSQKLTSFCATPDDVRKISADQFPCPGLALEFIDSRATHRAVAPESVWARYYHRCRAHVLGRHVVPDEIYFSENPIVSPRTSVWAGYTVHRGWKRWLEPRVLLRREQRRTIAADVAWGRSVPPQRELLRRAANVLGLEYGALDFARKADGSLVFWELNPHPDITPVWREDLPLVRRRGRAVRRIHDGIGEFVGDLLGSGD